MKFGSLFFFSGVSVSLVEQRISCPIYLFGFSHRSYPVELIFPSEIFQQTTKSWRRDGQAWMCPGWPRASSAARCPRREVAITSLPTWRWSRRLPSSSCCCSSSSWPCSSCAASASCSTLTAACPPPTGQTTQKKTRLITALSEEPKRIGNKLQIWLIWFAYRALWPLS